MRLIAQWVFMVVVVTCVAASPSIGFAADQDQPEQTGGLSYSDQYDRTRVTVDVFVRDRNDNPITGLTADQFRLFQDGDETAVSNFAAFSQDSFAEVAPELVATAGEVRDEGANADEAQPIFIVLFIDNQHLFHGDRNEVLRSLRSFVNEGLADHVQVMVVSYRQSIEIVQPFTNDRTAVANALRTLRLTEAALDDRDDDRQRIRREIRRATRNSYRRQSGDNQVLSDLYSTILTFAKEEDVLLEGTLNALRNTTTAMAGITGRKYVVYVSSGLPMVLIKDLLHEFAAINKQMTESALSTPFNRRRKFDTLAAAANAQEITIHAIDATGSGLSTTNVGDTDTRTSTTAAVIARENRQTPLALLAEKTGGLAVIRTDDFDAALDRIRSDFLTYYSIGYDIDSSGSDTVHHLEIKLNAGAETEYKTRYRNTFVAKSMESRVQDEVTTGLFFDVTDNPLSIDITPGAPVLVTESQWMQPLTVLLPVTSLAMTREADEYIGQVLLFVAMRNTEGSEFDLQRQVHDFRLPVDEYELRKDDHFNIFLRLLFASGKHDMVIGLLDQNTHQTSYKKVQTTTPDAS